MDKMVNVKRTRYLLKLAKYFVKKRKRIINIINNSRMRYLNNFTFIHQLIVVNLRWFQNRVVAYFGIIRSLDALH